MRMRRAETILKSQEESGVSQNDHPVVVLSFLHTHTHEKDTAQKTAAAAILNNLPLTPGPNSRKKTIKTKHFFFVNI